MIGTRAIVLYTPDKVGICMVHIRNLMHVGTIYKKTIGNTDVNTSISVCIF